MVGVKDQIMTSFKTDDCSKVKRVKTAYGNGKKQHKLNYKNSLKKTTQLKKKKKSFKLEKENEAIKDVIIRDIRTLLEQQDYYYKPIRVGNFWSNNHIEYESNGVRNKKNTLKSGSHLLKKISFYLFQ